MTFNQYIVVVKVNCLLMVLIPKKNKLTDFAHFKPICLLNCIMKILAKVLVDRLKVLQLGNWLSITSQVSLSVDLLWMV